jgi:hypothetical protein
MSQKQIDKAKAAGYFLERANSFEVGLVRHDKGIRTWYARDFGGKMPKLDHALVQEAIRIDHPPVALGEQLPTHEESSRARF